MTQINVTLKPSADKIAKAYGNADIRGFLSKHIEIIANKVQRFSKQVTPVDTGLLRSSIFTQPLGDLSHKVSTNKNYAIYVHEGTRFMKGRPFMDQGVRFTQRNLDGEIAEKLDKHLVSKLTRL